MGINVKSSGSLGKETELDIFPGAALTWVPAGLWAIGMQGLTRILASGEGTQESGEGKGTVHGGRMPHLKLEGMG